VRQTKLEFGAAIKKIALLLALN